jgi:hypothetical protein
MNLALGEVLGPVAPNVGDSGICLLTDRQAAVDAVNRAQRLLIVRLDAKGTVVPRCIDVCQEVFALPPEINEIRSVMVDGQEAVQREQSYEMGRHRGSHHWRHHCHGHELMDLGDGWATPTLLPQIPNAHLAISGVDADAGKTLTFRVLNRYNQWVTENLTIQVDRQMDFTQTDCYDVQFCSKPVTAGPVNVYWVAPDGTYGLLATYGPNITSPTYRRKRLPKHHGHHKIHRVKILGKLRYFPASADADQLVIGNLDAIIWGVKAITAQTLGDAKSFDQYIALAVNELEQELRDEESDATVAPIQVSTGCSFNQRRAHGRHWH